MIKAIGGMSTRSAVLLLAAIVATCRAGPLPTNITTSDPGLKEGSCALGDVVYLPGDEFPGSGPCERCSCTAGGVQCARQRCEPRPGCKAVHRPDHCCPIYQCECEQEGRIYGNGEKLVDPADPCRVCYCQGGEVVCRRIACFLRDDCRPRHVPGRCCPEYDNCPLRGVTTVSDISSTLSTTAEAPGSSPNPTPPKEIKQEITIKEITPVSEIPAITDVKIKEILPSPSAEVPEYSSSKSPLIVREATSEKNFEDVSLKTETPVVIEVNPSSSPVLISSQPPTKVIESFYEGKNSDQLKPSKISFSTQDSINSDIYPSNSPSGVSESFGSPATTIEAVRITTKAPIIEEEDTSLLDHNPAFPPLPDDLSVLTNHGDELVPDHNEHNNDNVHVSSGQEVVSVPGVIPLSTNVKEVSTTTTTSIPESSSLDYTTGKMVEPSTSTKFDDITTKAPVIKESPMLNLRSAIPTEILSAPSEVAEDINGELDEITEISTVSEQSTESFVSTRASPLTLGNQRKGDIILTDATTFLPKTTESEKTSHSITETTKSSTSAKTSEEITLSTLAGSSTATEIVSQTELSSLPVETSDQKPHDIIENTETNNLSTSTSEPLVTKLTSHAPEATTISRSSSEDQALENIETTEFIISTFGSSETSTDNVELIKISPDNEKNAAVIESSQPKENNVMTDLINLVGDVASIAEHTEDPEAPIAHTVSPINDSEELIPVNAGYKSKNNNWNQNSITEVPLKTKSSSVTKQKVVEIEEEDTESITDASPPHDKIEPTTKRPIIDNVSDDMPENKTTEKKDIEIITKSYVPTISRRPTKVVMKKSNDKVASMEELTSADTLLSTSKESVTEDSGLTSSEVAAASTTTRTEEPPSATTSMTQ